MGQRNGDFANFRFARRHALGPGLDTVGHRIAQHVFERRHHLVEHRAVEFHLTADDVEVGPLAQFLGGLANDAEQTLGLTGERHHAHAHQFLLQAAIEARLRDDGRVGIIEVLEQVLLHGRHVVDRLGHEAGELLEAGKAVEFERVEIRLPIVRLGDPRLNLALGLNFDFAQLTTQTDDVFRQVEQRALEAEHFAFDPRPRDGQFAGLVDQSVDQIGPDTQRCALCTGLGIVMFAVSFQ